MLCDPAYILLLPSPPPWLLTTTNTTTTTTTVIFFRSWDCTMTVTRVLTIIMMTEVEPSSFTLKLKQCIRLYLLVQLVSSVKNLKANGASIKAVKWVIQFLYFPVICLAVLKQFVNFHRTRNERHVPTLLFFTFAAMNTCWHWPLSLHMKQMQDHWMGFH